MLISDVNLVLEDPSFSNNNDESSNVECTQRRGGAPPWQQRRGCGCH